MAPNWTRQLRRSQLFGAATALCASALMVGCTPEVILPGERFDVRTPLDESLESVEANEAAQPVFNDGSRRRLRPGRGSEAMRMASENAMPTAVTNTAPISLPGQVNHSAWTHRGGSNVHRITHPALRAPLTQVWSASIGAGENRKLRITADPVAANGRVFTMDSQSRVMAHSTAGAPLWSRDLVPGTDSPSEASGGGLALSDGRLFVTTGFGQLYALNPTSGTILWEQDFDAPVAGSPTVYGDLVYVTSRDSRAFAVRTDNGRLQWQLPGAPTPSVTVNGAGPAVTDRLAIFPFGSAELVATLRQGGVRVWSASLAGARRGRSYTGFTDVSSDPVVVGNTVYAGSPSGRLVAIDATSGERIWTATEGSLSPVWVTGGAVFLVSDQNQLVRLDASSGEVVWAVDLPLFKRVGKPRRQQAVFAHYGPILAGGRLVVASDDGQLRSFDPRSGALVGATELRHGAATHPIVVGGTLYVVNTRGELLAFR